MKLTPVSRETEQRLAAYLDLLRKWQKRTNLVASSTLTHLWTRHVADSLQLLQLAPRAKAWIDIGSGGGFPGIVLACALAAVPGAQVHLVERNGKKAAFLREALRVTEGAGEVHLGDIADCVTTLPPVIDIVTARAVAPLRDLLGMADPWLGNGARGLFPKGLDVEHELQELTISGMFDIRLHESVTGNGRIVEVVPSQNRM